MEYGESFAANGCNDWGGIACCVVGGFPDGFACVFVEGDDACAFGAAGVEENQVLFDDGG